MHRLPSQQSVHRFRLVALLVLATRLLVVGSPMLLGYALVVADRDLSHLALGLLSLVVPITHIQWIGAARLRCPLCIGTPLAHNRCAKSRRARRLFGSYRLRVALAILTEDHFRCPLCGEFTAIAVRRRRSR